MAAKLSLINQTITPIENNLDKPGSTASPGSVFVGYGGRY